MKNLSLSEGDTARYSQEVILTLSTFSLRPYKKQLCRALYIIFVFLSIEKVRIIDKQFTLFQIPVLRGHEVHGLLHQVVPPAFQRSVPPIIRLLQSVCFYDQGPPFC